MSNQIRRDREQTAYDRGYRTGRDSERIIQEDNYVHRENSSVSSGIVMGMALALLATIVGAGAYFFSQQQTPTRQSAPATQIIPVPVPNNNSQPQTSTPKKETTIIERTIDKTRDVVPVPAPSPQSSSQDSSTSQPNININIPPAQQPTENKTAPTQSQTDSSKPESSQTNK